MTHEVCSQTSKSHSHMCEKHVKPTRDEKRRKGRRDQLEASFGEPNPTMREAI